jgi:hemin uptake protein HemP
MSDKLEKQHAPAQLSSRSRGKRRVDSQELLGENGELIIEHAGQEYCLRKTRQNQNKLILMK